MTILIVDDDTAVAELIGALLRKIAGKIEVATSFYSAKEFVQKMIFDLILLDIGLPDSPSFQTITRVNELKEGGAKVVILTGAWPPNAELTPEQTGADDVLYKGDMLLNEKILALC